MSTEEIIRQRVENIGALFKDELGKGAEPHDVELSNAMVTNVCALVAQVLVDLHRLAGAGEQVAKVLNRPK
ncbi:hypothetical protein V5F34_08695 [Xanthobacter autotrophicus]|uniref:hypothetical protein n=1 Tax=Xanthobacter autotrophicus TaxID=280 RepID=UPI00372CE2AE